jgi:hypothetical protein
MLLVAVTIAIGMTIGMDLITGIFVKIILVVGFLCALVLSGVVSKEELAPVRRYCIDLLPRRG